MNELDAHSRQILACLGDASRFRLVDSLLHREQCVSELAASVGLSQSCTTRHLQYLERHGLVRGRREGKRVLFRLRSDLPRVRELLSWATAAHHGAADGQVAGADLHHERSVPIADGGPSTVVRLVDGEGGQGRRAHRPARVKGSGSRAATGRPPRGDGREPRSPLPPDIENGRESDPRSGPVGRPHGDGADERSGEADRPPADAVPPALADTAGESARPRPPARHPREVGSTDMEDWLL